MQLNMNAVDRINQVQGYRLPRFWRTRWECKRRGGKLNETSAGSRLNVYYDSHQNNEVSKAPNDTPESRESNSEGKDLLVSQCDGAAPRLGGAARRVMDRLLRECLRPRSLHP